MSWLFDQCPPDFRAHELLRRQPVLLARLSAEHIAAAVEACRHGLGTARAELRGVVAPEVIDDLIALYEYEGARLTRVAEAVELIGTAFRGRRFVPRL